MDSATLMALWDAVDGPDAERMPVQWHRRAHAALVAAGSIEAFMRPSPAPGVAKEDGGREGASPTQMHVWGELDRIIGGTHPQRKRIAAVSGSNQCGKTVACYARYCRYLRDEAPHGSIHWLIAASIDSIKGVPLRTVWNMLPRSMFGSWSYHPARNLPTTITLMLPGGRGHIELKPMTENQDLQEFEQERLTSWLWSECRREAIFHALEPRGVAHGAFGIMDYIPIEPWHRELEENSATPDSKVFHVRMSIVENQHNLAEHAVHDMKPKALGGRGTMSVEEWRLRGEGIPAAYEGVVYKQFDPAVHCVPAFAVPKQWPLWMGGDWGYRNPHAFALATVAPNEQVYVVAEEYDNETTVFDVCRRLWSMVGSIRPMDCGAWGDEDALFRALRVEFNQPRTDELGRPIERVRPVRDWIRKQWLATLAYPCVIDASVFDRDQSDGTSLADEFELCGFPVLPSVKANKDGGVELVRRYFEQRRLFFFAGCTYTRRDHAVWRYKENKDREPDPDDRYERRHDHACAAIMYLLRSGPCHHPNPLVSMDGDATYQALLSDAPYRPRQPQVA